jgi:tRNA pseudouridine32 synthase/23S rRNA pseudouridine746 synthase
MVEDLDKLPHDFAKDEDALGKMFGILIVRSSNGETGYLKAFSGKLFGGNKVKGYVPPVFDTLDPQAFYIKGEEEIVQVNLEITKAEEDPKYKHHINHLENAQSQYQDESILLKEELKLNKLRRHQKRNELKKLTDIQIANKIEADLNNESARDHYRWKDFTRAWNQKLNDLKEILEPYQTYILNLKTKRRHMSGVLQDKLFDSYKFLNAINQVASIKDIFHTSEDNIPPSGAGECAAPKLLQYAYQHGYQPIAIAEFWWGKSPQSEIRKHGHFYPACRSKCLPILTHMLVGLSVDPNPMTQHDQTPSDIQVIMDDDEFIVVNKPAGLLSVRGKTDLPSIETILKEKYGEVYLVHRLDMSTSGILLIAKTMDSYKILQQQFITRSVVKKYMALLGGIPKDKSGVIDLPLRVDLDNRPRQLVDPIHGKNAKTIFKIKKVLEDKALVEFIPITGRTHQLRAHAAHSAGLNTPIYGDDLYGLKADRLYLHATFLKFDHPITGKPIEIYSRPEFI